MTTADRAVRLRFKAQINPKPTTPLDPTSLVSFLPMEAIGDDGSLQLDQTRIVSDVSQGYTFFENGDVSIAKITPCFENGKGAVMKGLIGGIGFGTTELIILRPAEGVDSTFLYYLTQSRHFRQPGVAAMQGSGGQKRVPDLFVKDFKAEWPSLVEQRRITSYLDGETARIDSLVREKTRLVSALTELERATAYELVTGRLTDGAPTKESGLEWLPRVPAHWTVKRNMFLFQQRHEPGLDGLPILKVSLHTGVTEGDEEEGSARVRRRMEDKSSYQIVRRGDVAYNMMRAWQGAIGAVPVDGLVSPAYVVLTPSVDLDPRFFELLARTAGYVKEFERHSYGIASFRWRLYWEGFKEIGTPVPPIEEQRAIVAAFSEERDRIAMLRDHVERELELLAELRATTISDAVLGRIDVRGYARQRLAKEATA